MKDMLKQFLKKNKGKLLVSGTVLLLGIPVVAGTMGIHLVDGPEGAACFSWLPMIDM